MSMSEHKKLVKEHYDKHVKAGLTTKEALQQRRQGVALPLKRFHNDIKRRLIARFAYGVDGLLDYACGRGGDIHKWKSANIKYVRGLDLSGAEVQEAQRRFDELRQKDGGMALDADFEQNEHLGDQLVDEGQQFDAVTCMFALHYFFEREAMIKTFLQNAAHNLKSGGYFFGTVPDGKRIVATLRGQREFHSPLFHLYQRWQGKHSSFGSGYTMEISDTVVEGHGGDSCGSPEFLVFQNVLTALAAAVGLHPVIDYGDPELLDMFEEDDAEKPYKHFKPNYPPDTHVSLKYASQVYMAFVFQKVDAPEQVTAPPLPSSFPPPPPLPSTNPYSNGHQQTPHAAASSSQPFGTAPGPRDEAPGPSYHPATHDMHAPPQPPNAAQYQPGPGPGSSSYGGYSQPPPPHQQQYHQQPYQQQPYQQHHQQQHIGQYGGPPPPYTGAPMRQGPLPSAYAIAKQLLQNVPIHGFVYTSRPAPEPQWQFGADYSQELDQGRAGDAARLQKLLDRARAAAERGVHGGQAPAGHMQAAAAPHAQASRQQLAAATGAPSTSQGTKRPYQELAGEAAVQQSGADAGPPVKQPRQQQQQQQEVGRDPAGYGRQAVSYDDMYDDVDDAGPPVGPQYSAR